MSDLPSVYALLKKYNLRPKKGLGQNFLTDANHLQKIIQVADLSPQDTVLEIGPGLGSLSVLLAQNAQAVVAVELDKTMVRILETELGQIRNLSVVESDILALEPGHLLAQTLPDFQVHDDYVVVANLPYYITSALLRHLLEGPHPPRRIVVTIQKEVAQRIVAEPGHLSLLAISVQFYGRPQLHHSIPRTAFFPAPNVDSAVLSVDLYDLRPVDAPDPKDYFRVVKAGFSQKRKQLKNALAGGLHVSNTQASAWLEVAHIAPNRRAETLSLTEWAALAKVVYTSS